MRELRGRAAIVTGASRGIGTFIAGALAREGMRLLIAARSTGELEAIASELRASGGQVTACAADVGNAAGREGLVAAARRELGGIDVLVNNAGIECMGAFDTFDATEMARIIDVNLTASLALARLCLPDMVAARRGHIVNIASLAGKSGAPFNAPYAASKGGLIAFTRALRIEYHGTGVSASVICPGFVSEAGMFHRTAGGEIRPPRLLGISPPARVAGAVVRAIRRDLSEIVVNPGPMRLVLALGELSPRFSEWTVRALGVTEIFRKRIGRDAPR
ncbi:MAG: SDR family oxidoreductase [Acidobacteriota bacterium]